jgi:hypothetical protein
MLLIRSYPLSVLLPVLSNQAGTVSTVLLWFPSVVAFIPAQPLDQKLALEDRRSSSVLLASNLHILVGNDCFNLPLQLAVNDFRRWWGLHTARLIALQQRSMKHWV